MDLTRFDERQWRSWGGVKKYSSTFTVLALCLSHNVPRLYEVFAERMREQNVPKAKERSEGQFGRGRYSARTA